ncbi:MAG: nucleotide exchange factor GrpE [Bacilli bacterium]|nr:nucleotide exchange factor GrpE [Bacilli bacterium]
MKEQNNRYREEEKQQENQSDATEPVKEKPSEVTSEAKDVELEKQKNLYIRLYADFENFKKRSIEERSQYLKYSSQSILEKLVNVTDLFDKAVSIQTEDEKLKNFLIGFQMINQSFKQILTEEGVKKIEAVGKIFDPNVHHAVEVEYQPNKKENIILAEMQSGYVYKDRLLRPSLVVVNKKQERKDENE